MKNNLFLFMKYKKFQSLSWRERFTYRKNVVFDENDLKQAGVSFQIVRFPAGASISEHWHKHTAEIFFVKSGYGMAVMNGEKINLEPGDCLLCEPGDRHAFSNNGAEDLTLLDFKINEAQDDIFWAGEAGK